MDRIPGQPQAELIAPTGWLVDSFTWSYNLNNYVSHADKKHNIKFTNFAAGCNTT